jgi:hypothetical protein
MCAVPTKVFAPATTWHPLSSCIRSSTPATLSACYHTTHEVAHNSHLEFCAWLLTPITYKPQTSSCTYEWMLSAQTLDHGMHLLMGCVAIFNQHRPYNITFHVSFMWHQNAHGCTHTTVPPPNSIKNYSSNHSHITTSTCSLRHALKSKYFLFYCKYCISDKHFLPICMSSMKQQFPEQILYR